VPENVYFIVDDATEDDWLWDENHFDFIRAGLLSGSLPSMKDLVSKAFKYLKPGGYFENLEIHGRLKCDDGTLPPMDPDIISDYAVQDFLELSHISGLQADPPKQVFIAHKMEGWMKKAGFVDIQVRKYKIPITPWSTQPRMHQLGIYMQANWMEAVSGWAYKPLVNLGWSKAEIEVFLIRVRESLHNLNVHAYHDFYVVTGRKPLLQESSS
jgi:hypothetical protein